MFVYCIPSQSSKLYSQCDRFNKRICLYWFSESKRLYIQHNSFKGKLCYVVAVGRHVDLTSLSELRGTRSWEDHHEFQGRDFESGLWLFLVGSGELQVTDIYLNAAKILKLVLVFFKPVLRPPNSVFFMVEPSHTIIAYKHLADEVDFIEKPCHKNCLHRNIPNIFPYKGSTLNHMNNQILIKLIPNARRVW